MAAKKGTKKAAAPQAPKKKTTVKGRAPRKAKEATAGLTPAQAIEVRDPGLDALVERIRHEGGEVVGSYRDPLGGHPAAIAVLPIDKVTPTPFQRDLSESHEKRLAEVMQRLGHFLDPVIAITAPSHNGGGGFWTPNGRHRLAAMQRLGARAITALVMPERELAWQILALNTEKAPNLKERALEVIRIYRGLIEEDASRPESKFAFFLEEAALVTIGVCYERLPRFAGGAYHPILRRLEEFTDAPRSEAIDDHERRADLVLELETNVADVVARLKERGFTSPYLRAFVVARINPLRWMKGELPSVEEVLTTMRDRAARFDVGKIKQEDVARVGGAPAEEE